MGSQRVRHDWATELNWTLEGGSKRSYSKLCQRAFCLCLKYDYLQPMTLNMCSCLANPMDGGAWWAAIYGVAQSQTLLKWLSSSMSVESVMPSNHLILCHPLLFLPSIFPSIRVFSNESALCIRWAKYWSFSFSISPSSEHSGLISFRMEWLDLLAVQGTLKSLLQHHSSKVSILQCSAFFMVQHSHLYMTTRKN